MKKRISLVLVLVLILSLCIAACGNDSGGGNNSSSSIAGVYRMVSMSMDGEMVDVESLVNRGVYITEPFLELNDDGTGEYASGHGYRMDMKYENGKIWPVESPDEAVSFSVSGNRLTLTEDGETMIFEK